MLFSCLFTFILVYFRTCLSTPSRKDPFRFQAGGCRRQPNLALVSLVLILCRSIFCYGCMFAFVVFVFVFDIKPSNWLGKASPE